ncbi:MAG: LOG family protein [bacterium]|nr:LOG family protein [bacterium]
MPKQIHKTIKIPSQKVRCSIDRVAIFGSADVDEKHPLYEEVFSVAQYLAYHNKVVIDGGGPGTMLAATRGAQAAGGKTVTVTFNPVDMPEFEGKDVENTPDKEIKAANYIERMFGLINEADAFICFQGGTGTLSEWATVWLLSHLYYGNHKPIILYGAFWKDVMKTMNEHFFVGEKENAVYKIATNQEELIEALNAFETELADRCGLPRRG